MRMANMAALAVLAAASLALAPAASPAADLKVGVVDLQKALNASDEGTRVKEVLKEKYQVKQDQIEARKKELKDIEDKLKSSVIKPEAKAVLQQDRDKKREELREYAAKAQYEFEKDNQSASQKIMDGLIDISRKIAKDEGYTLMLEKSASGLVFYLDALDLTERVMKIYDEKNPPTGEKKP
jgi:outer membrane protein